MILQYIGSKMTLLYPYSVLSERNESRAKRKDNIV